jgi:GNAT superfamily N-acetyltransferase
MAKSDSLSLGSAVEGDLSGLAELMARENGGSQSEAYLRWWYLENPAEGYSLEIARDKGAIVGMATINDAILFMDRGRFRFGIPQKVLVDSRLRGKGLFGRLYRAAETLSWKRGVDGFITFTNSASTPIFLSRFGYLRGVSPDVLLFASSPSALFRHRRFEVHDCLPREALSLNVPPAKAGFLKDEKYLAWRYCSFSAGQFVFLRVEGTASVPGEGWAVLKRTKKFGLPIFLLMDLIGAGRDLRSRMLEISIAYATRECRVGLVALDSPDYARTVRSSIHIRLRNRFNFLVKGRNSDETGRLSATPFEFSFGDLDFT